MLYPTSGTQCACATWHLQSKSHVVMCHVPCASSAIYPPSMWHACGMHVACMWHLLSKAPRETLCKQMQCSPTSTHILTHTLSLSHTHTQAVECVLLYRPDMRRAKLYTTTSIGSRRQCTSTPTHAYTHMHAHTQK